MPSRFTPPQYSEEFPLQTTLQSFVELPVWSTDVEFMVFPQRHWPPSSTPKY